MHNKYNAANILERAQIFEVSSEIFYVFMDNSISENLTTINNLRKGFISTRLQSQLQSYIDVKDCIQYITYQTLL